MKESKDARFPYKSLGTQLKNLREKKHESLAEVCGAVEIDLDHLSAIEAGKRRPSEDILILLVNHFDPKEDLITKLWELAGYSREAEKSTANNASSDFQPQLQPAIMVMPIDGRIVYSDTVHVMVNNHGVVMNFMQNAGHDNKPIAIARIGMSKDHAKSVLDVLRQTLAQHEQKTLPSPKQSDQDTDKTS